MPILWDLSTYRPVNHINHFARAYRRIKENAMWLFIIGLFIGAYLGWMIAALCASASHN